MARVIAHVTMSLDGFMAGPDVGTAFPMGRGGESLHQWIFDGSSEVDAAAVRQQFALTGAVLLGRRTFDVGVDVWGDTPYPVPCFVLTHRPEPVRTARSGTFTFVHTGLSDAVEQAIAAAGERAVTLMGAEVVQQVLRAGLLDEIHLQLAPVLLGGGRRLFEHLGTGHIALEQLASEKSPHVTHLRYRVVK
ncbi:deaminase reductase [Catellatospora methionotrophica]|uniref:Deaminase reductase n=1 Tax=Catellatospora methionotrophica TaxID=121620 RepID=A0A8J3LCT8_9ACTN|nr:dihydrofolate reductase family protein [Catellatospora methionotrophica]GIG16154.1 deaminase reductase [Catellatospora methionotrophica]